MLTFVVEVIERFRDAFETKRENGKLVDRFHDLERELEDVRSIERLVCVNLKVVTTSVQTLEAKIKYADAKYTKVVGKEAHTKKRVFVLVRPHRGHR